jgi:PIN domain nuclease of toxin-antitoxin system
MKLLLDTHAFIWWDSDPSRLSTMARDALCDPANTILLSVTSVWEMVIKAQLSKLSLRLPLSDIIAQQQTNGLKLLNITVEHVLAVESLPATHKDPFDRLLVAQANTEGASLVTADRIFVQYSVPILW